MVSSTKAKMVSVPSSSCPVGFRSRSIHVCVLVLFPDSTLCFSGCIACQYIVERIANNVDMAGIAPQYLGGRPVRQSVGSGKLVSGFNIADAMAAQRERKALRAKAAARAAAEAVARGDYAASLLEVETSASTTSSQFPYQAPFVPGAHNFEPYLPYSQDQPGSRSYQQAVERQKFSLIYHVSEQVLDHVCDASMPNEFFKYCKLVYSAQGAIVNMLGRQFGTQTICRRLEMCDKDSYVNKDVHFRGRQIGVGVGNRRRRRKGT